MKFNRCGKYRCFKKRRFNRVVGQGQTQISWSWISLDERSKKWRLSKMRSVDSDFDPDATLGYARCAEHTERLRRHRVKVRKSFLPA